MAHILKNENVEIRIDSPLENYRFSRFDWTGKIVDVKFQNVQLAISERMDDQNEDDFGKGFYNEFGIDTALGFEEAHLGGWFHKIGVGLLNKVDGPYLFSKKYEIRPAKFEMIPDGNKLVIICTSESMGGYAYVLRKEITLSESGFTIKYHLENTGEKDIVTTEYNHNFMAMNQELMGDQYVLKFPFQLKPESFDETDNPGGKVDIGADEIRFTGSPKNQFFFSNLTGHETVNAHWELTNHTHKIGIRETGSFQTDKINLWGWKHVISPELFIKISIKPGETAEWSRKYEMFKVV